MTTDDLPAEPDVPVPATAASLGIHESEAARMLRQAREAQGKPARTGFDRQSVMLLAGISTSIVALMGIQFAVFGPPKPHKLVPPATTSVVQPKASTAPETVSPKPIQSAASRYAERIQKYWLPEVAAMPDRVPADEDAFGKVLSQIDGMVTNIEDGDVLNFDPAQTALRTKLILAVGRKQAALFPDLRRRYGSAMNAKLFRRDISVSVSGTTMRLVGYPFARNENIEDMQTALLPGLNRLRFRRVEYRWDAQIGGGYHYDLSPPSDTTVAHWDGEQFGAAIGQR